MVIKNDVKEGHPDFRVDTITPCRKKENNMYKIQEKRRMEQKHIVLIVTGGIAAYKAIDLAGSIVKEGYSVQTVLTKNALNFVSALDFKAITHSPVYTEMFTNDDPIPHITLADWADLVVVAPATANLIAKAAHGLADDLASSLLLAHPKPVLWVPAMNVHMYNHPATQENLQTLLQRGNYVLEPVTGMLACGYEGKGKFPPVEEILSAIKTYLHYSRDLIGKKVLITAGGTAEPIDPMRTVTNRSSGKTGLALARTAALRGAEVNLVYADVSVSIPYYLNSAVYTQTAAEMAQAVEKLAPEMDIIVMAAAVSDFTPLQPSAEKIKKSAALELKLRQTEDILQKLGQIKKTGQKLIGFAAETENLSSNAKTKLEQKNLDLIIANDIQVCGRDETEMILLTKNSQEQIKADKFQAAHLIWDKIKEL